MSHKAIAAIWAELEERADLATTLRDAVGKYAIQSALYRKEPLNPENMRAFNQLISILRTVFHLQRIYLQSRQPSSKIEPFLMDPSLITDVLVYILQIQNDLLPDRQDLHPEEDQLLRSIGAVLLAGLRLLTLCKRKVLPDQDWLSKTERLKSKLSDWPLCDKFHRILIGELCVGLLKDLSSNVESPLTSGVKTLCAYHNNHLGAGDDGDLPDFYDGLYPLKAELVRVVFRAMTCISFQCPWWFHSFCIWYDIWSAVIGASVQLYRHNLDIDMDASGETLARFVSDLIEEVRSFETACHSLRFAAIFEILFSLNPFPQCSANGCHCFGYFIEHQYQEPQYPGVWSKASTEAVDLQLDIAADLMRRKHSLRDADGHLQNISRNVQECVRNWTELGEERTLQPGQLKTYIINCPELHPLTSQVLSEHLAARTPGSGAAEDVRRSEPLVEIGGLQCPTCENESFTHARLVAPLTILEHNLNDAPRHDHGLEELPWRIKPSPDRPKRVSTSSKSVRSSSSRSMLRVFQRSSSSHSKKESGENASQGSPKSKSFRPFNSHSSSPKLFVSSVLFTDGKFVLASTSNRISCYDCDLETWSKDYAFTKILLVAGSSIRYAVVSKETQIFKLTVFRRDRISDKEEFSRFFETQPQSIAISRQGHKIALGFEKEVYFFDLRTRSAEKLLSGCPQSESSDIKIHSQRLSFSLCGDHLVVASRAASVGKIFVIVHDLHHRKSPQIYDLKISTAHTGDSGLSSVIYDPPDHGSGTIFVCSSVAQENWLIDTSDSQKTREISNRTFRRFHGQQIQCAIAVPGNMPQIAMVNHSNNVFILRFINNEWYAEEIKVKLEGGRGEVVKTDDRMSIAAVNDAVHLFWMQGQEGRMLTIDEISGFQQKGTNPSEKITFPF